MALEWCVRERDPARRDAVPALFQTNELDAVRAWYERLASTEIAAPGEAPARAFGASPLHSLPALAADLGVAGVLVKDETARFGLPSFKILGAHYAIGRLASRPGAGVTDLACATAGNHGLAVAVAGRAHACEVHVSVPIGTPRLAVDAILAAGAHVVATSVDYDATVRLMAADAVEHGWTMVSDTAWDGGDDATARAIMAGYTRLMDEAASQWTAPPDVIVVQAGVGSLAAAVAAWLQARWPAGAPRPRLVIAEPSGAACVLASLRASRRVDLERCAPTIMAGLRCARVSTAAWPLLHATVDAAVAISDDDCRAAQARLSQSQFGDPAIAAGPSGACSVAALIAICTAPDLAKLRDALQLNAASRCLAIATEGVLHVPSRPYGWQFQRVVNSGRSAWP